jgi:TolB-like protein/DNA-binding SARP family transcriptional activator
VIELRILGSLQLSASDGRDLASLARQSKRAALLCYLAAAVPEGLHRRDTLLALFWPELDETHARASLSQALYVLRNALGDQGIVTRGDDEVGLSPAIVWCDARAFETALDAGQPATALALYRGGLLDGFFVSDAPEFGRWVERERERLRDRAADGAWALAEARAAAQDAVQATRWARWAAALAPADEVVIRRLMTFLRRLGDQAAALRAYEAFAFRLTHEYELAPSAETRALAAAIRAGSATPFQTPAPPTPSSEGTIAARPPLATAHPLRVPRWLLWTVGVAAVVGLAWPGLRSAAHRPRTAIAVLPFRNLNTDTSLAHFADGLHDELVTQLTKVAALTVIGRTSVSGYQQTSKSPRQIGEELGVGSIVEGSVQVVGNRLRVSVQLLDPVTQADRWAERYDRTVDDAFAVQSDIARQIVAQLGARLTDPEAEALAAAPTQNSQAYLFYLQGLDYFRRPGVLRQNLVIAQQLFERALGLDSTFAPAHARLSVVHHTMHYLGYDRSPSRVERAQREAERALRLAPDLSQARLASGLALHVVQLDYQGALEDFTLGLHGAPNDAELWFWIGNVRRHLGQWDGALAAYTRAQQLDPRNPTLLHMMGDMYHYLHRYREAIAWYRGEIALAPDVVQARLSMAWSYILWKGDLDTLRSVLQSLPGDPDPGMGGATSVALSRLLLVWMERRPDSVLSLARVLGRSMGQTAAPANLSYWTEPAYRLRGDTAAARAVLDSALRTLTAWERTRPDDYDVHVRRGLVLAKLGRHTDALREARWLAEWDQRHDDQYDNGVHRAERALILAHAGAPDAAVAELERELAGPSLTTVPYLRLDLNWAPIWRDPRFHALLEKHANPEVGHQQQ